jgi:aminopeptidase-like protein
MIYKKIDNEIKVLKFFFDKIFKNFSSYNGYEINKTLKILKDDLKIKIINFSSKKKIRTWKLPKYRKITKAILKQNGKIILDYKENKFFVLQNSISVKRNGLSFKQLKPYLNFSIKCPEGIPLHNAAYLGTWGFSLPYKQYLQIDKNAKFDVEIKSIEHNIGLKVGELFIKGMIKKEILFDVVISCPSLGNNVSAIVVVYYLVKYLQKNKNYFSYRILFTPETIGPLSILSRIKKNKYILGGTCFTNLGHGKYFNYKATRNGNKIIDKAVRYLKKKDKKIEISLRKFDSQTGFAGNEKAYNSLGYNCEMGNFSRAILNTYAEYDTHLDDKNFISFRIVSESLEKIKNLISIIELERKFKYNFVGEPSYVSYGLSDQIKDLKTRSIIDFLVNHSDGNSSLLDFALNTDFKLEDLYKFSNILNSKKILKKIEIK